MRAGVRTVVLGGPRTIASLNFTNNTYSLNGKSYAAIGSVPGWSYSRTGAAYAQTASGTLQLFSANTPRVTSQGMLIEAAGTNNNIYSQGAFSTQYASSNVGITDNNATDPDGAATASTLTDNSTSGSHAISGTTTTFSYVNGTTYTQSMYFKNSTLGFVQMSFPMATFTGGGYVNFNLSTGVIAGSGGTGISSSGIQALANGWYRCWITGAASASAAGAMGVVFLITSGSATRGQSYVGSGHSILLWGAQFEQASSPSSYIPTTSAAVTRGADVAALTYSPNGSSATLLYTNGIAAPSPTSPINFGASSGGAWVGSYIKTVVVKH